MSDIASRLSVEDLRAGYERDVAVLKDISVEVADGKVTGIIGAHELEFDIEWGTPGLPYQTRQGTLVEAVAAGIFETTGRNPELSATGGTSDGRFIAPTGAQVVEFGPLNATIHQINEQVSVADLDLLSVCYENILERVLTA